MYIFNSGGQTTPFLPFTGLAQSYLLSYKYRKWQGRGSNVGKIIGSTNVVNGSFILDAGIKNSYLSITRREDTRYIWHGYLLLDRLIGQSKQAHFFLLCQHFETGSEMTYHIAGSAKLVHHWPACDKRVLSLRTVRLNRDRICVHLLIIGNKRLAYYHYFGDWACTGQSYR